MQQEYFSDTQLATRYDIGRATVWRWVERGLLPKPEKLSPGTTRWSRKAIEERDAERAAAQANK